MKRVIVSEMITLNGFFCGTNGEVDWFMWDENTDRETFELLSQADCLLLGFKTYKLLSGYWPNATEENPRYIERINCLPKLVVCSQPRQLEWNAKPLIVQTEQELVDAIRIEKGSKNLLIFGSGSVVSVLTKHKMIDHYRLFLNPLLLDEGKPLFHSVGDTGQLKFKGATNFDNGVVLLEYNNA